MTIHASWVDWSANDPETEVAIVPNLRFPKYLDAFVSDEPDLDVDLRISAVFDPDRGKYVVDRFEARRRGPSDDITGTSIRSVRVQDYLRTAVRNAFRIGQISERSRLFNMEFEPDAATAERVRLLGPSNDEALEWAARIYRFAVAVSDSPSRAIQQQLGMSAPTAAVWIRRARDRGILMDPTPANPAESQRRFELAREVAGYEDWS